MKTSLDFLAPTAHSSAVSAESCKVARNIYRRFMFKPGATRIASAFSLARLAQLVFETKPRRVLEVGAGIGTITELLLSHPLQIEKVVSIEDNAFCREQIQRNISGKGSRWVLVENFEQIATHKPFDLVIFDGSQYEEVAYLLAPGVICFIDGNRQRTRGQLVAAAHEKGLDLDVESFASPKRIALRQSSKSLLGYKIRWGRDDCHIVRCRLQP